MGIGFGGGNCMLVLSEDGLENACGICVWAKSRQLASTTISHAASLYDCIESRIPNSDQ